MISARYLLWRTNLTQIRAFRAPLSELHLAVIPRVPTIRFMALLHHSGCLNTLQLGVEKAFFGKPLPTGLRPVRLSMLESWSKRFVVCLDMWKSTQSWLMMLFYKPRFDFDFSHSVSHLSSQMMSLLSLASLQ